MKKTDIKFGTDGWRGIIADDFTFENVRVVAQSISDYIKREPPASRRDAKVAVGFDSRFLSPEFARELACVLAANGISVILSDTFVPTPVISFTAKDKRLDAGIMITASHNLAMYNGIKIKTSSGGAAGVQVTKAVESLLYRNKPKRLSFNEAVSSGRLKVMDLTRRYLGFLRSYLDESALKKSKLKVIVDAMHGSGGRCIGEILKSSNIKFSILRQELNPSFGGMHPEPIARNLKELTSQIKQGRFDLGLALDGDADRIGAMTPKGEHINANKIISLLLLHLLQDRKMSGAVVKTIASGMLIEKIAQNFGLKIFETPVGFKYISQLMEKEDVLIGGEEAGGIGIKGYIPERDGILCSLLLVEMMACRKKTIFEITSDMENEFGRFFYLREDIQLKNLGARQKSFKIQDLRRPDSLLGKKVVEIKDYDGLKFICEDDSWLLLRQSGTEPIVRVYAEARSPGQVKKLIEQGRRWIGS
jgi:alpha-D-glucose phosphate-specific phosphoglucomutase